jgi:hypothetical protein
MSDQPTIKQRLAILEREVRELKKQLKGTPSPDSNWVERMSGSMVDFPEFDEVVRLGRENRQADLPTNDGGAR